MRGPVIERMVDADQALHWALAAEAEIAAGVDDEGRIAAQPLGGEVGGEALAAAAGVDADPGGPRRPPCDGVDAISRQRESAHGRRGLSFGGDGERVLGSLAGGTSARELA